MEEKLENSLGYFDCSICFEDTLKPLKRTNQLQELCKVPSCNHIFHRNCFQGWEEDCIKRGLNVTCPLCNLAIEEYHEFKYPRAIVDYTMELETKVSNKTNEVNTLTNTVAQYQREKSLIEAEKEKVEGQLDKVKSNQDNLHRIFEEFKDRHANVIKAKEDEIARFEKTIHDMEQNKEEMTDKTKDIEKARDKLSELEREKALLQKQQAQELAEKRREQQENEKKISEMQEKIDHLQEMQETMNRRSSTSEVLGAITNGVNVASSYLYGGWMLVQDKFLKPAKHLPLLKDAKLFKIYERRGNHCNSPVWHASDGETHYAIKRKQKKNRDLSVYEECMLLSQLNHPNIIKLNGILESHNVVCIIMPFVEMDLEYFLSQGRALDVNVQPKITKKILAALSYIHAHSVVHRNLSPSAILLDEQKDVKIVSWTQATSLKSRPLTPLVCRGLRYQSPEFVMFGEQISDWKAFDMWSVGCILWELLLETNVEPVVKTDVREMSERLRMFCGWKELRDEAQEWKEQQQGSFPVLEKVLQEQMVIQSMKGLLNSKNIISEQAVSFVMELLHFDPAKRIDANNAKVHQFLSSFQVDKGEELSDVSKLADVEEWVNKNIKGK